MGFKYIQSISHISLITGRSRASIGQSGNLTNLIHFQFPLLLKKTVQVEAFTGPEFTQELKPVLIFFKA